MPPRAVNAFERLAPDQRAAVELVLRGRGYAELAGLLGIPEATVRERARGGLEALAPDLPPPARAGEIADWLLGQDGDGSLVAGDAAARRWAETVAAPLRELPGASVPALPPVAEPALPVSPPPGAAASPPPVSPPPGAPPTAVTGRSSRRGGAVLIAAAVVVVGAVLAVVLTRGGHDGATAAGNAPPAATAAATGTPQAQPNDIVLRGPAGSKSVGLMRLIRANDNSVRFALAAQDVPPNTGKDTYSIWFRKKDGTALRLGVAQSPVGKDGTLTTAGPRNEDVAKFPQWFVSYDNVLVTRDSSPSAKQPGRVILSGDLPSASPSG